jgi:hypothetical protein
MFQAPFCHSYCSRLNHGEVTIRPVSGWRSKALGSDLCLQISCLLRQGLELRQRGLGLGGYRILVCMYVWMDG